MNYELAKRLKDARFPKETFMVWKHESHKYDSCKGHIENAPTLSELIEACGEEFTELSKRSDGWSAVYYYGYNPDLMIPMNFKRGVGTTPSEAVAMLFLELNETK